MELARQIFSDRYWKELLYLGLVTLVKKVIPRRFFPVILA